MPQVLIDNVSVKVKDRFLLRDLSLTIKKQQFWVIIGPNACGKSALVKLLDRALKTTTGVIHLPDKIQAISFEAVTDILNRERYLDNSNISGGYDAGTTTAAFIFAGQNLLPEQAIEIQTRFNLSDLLDQGIKFLSTGEMRKALICRALVDQPDLLILDEPFDGLDQNSRIILQDLIRQIITAGTQVILLLNRSSEIPQEATHIALMKHGQIIASGSKNDILALMTTQNTSVQSFPQRLNSNRPAEFKHADTAKSPAIIEMKHVNIRYRDKAILTDLNWRVETGQHWMISGPNGSGKTTLLNLITGDNTQGYANDITLFGQRKGSGESVWEIKRKIGHISTSLQREYRVRSTVLDVILSGFYDSIGMYTKPTKIHLEIAEEWLIVLKMEQLQTRSFQNLSFGQQRLVLLARAMVKQPQLLILDEPCQGLDDKNRDMFLSMAQKIGSQENNQILYVTHRPEDEIPCIQCHLKLIPCDPGGYTGSISFL